MIECTHISVGYGKKEILSDVSFTAETGKITILLGRNGCGKSTLLRAVSGSLAYRGKISVDGREIAALRPGQRARCVAVMPQMMRAPQMTVREFVGLGRQPYTGLCGILSPADHEKVEDVLGKTNLVPLADAYLPELSGGERQKAYFALLLAQDTPCLLLDEPGSHLDAEYNKALNRFLLSERERGKTVLAVLHDINQALEIADKIIVLHQRAVAFAGTPAAFADSFLPETLFGLCKYRCLDTDADAHPDTAGNSSPVWLFR